MDSGVDGAEQPIRSPRIVGWSTTGRATMEDIHVLVVEDETLLHDLLEEALDGGGFSVTLVLKGNEAIAALEAPDAVWSALVTDIRLGREQPTGWDVARRARELNPTIPIVYMTGDSSADWAANGVPNSVLLTKPFAPAQVVTAVAQLLNTDSAPKP
jgi:CheY-like chemotaxis protein